MKKYGPLVARLLLGLVFLGSGIFGLLITMGVVPMPVPKELPSEGAAAFFTGMTKSGYLMPLIKTTETVCGALLLANFYVPLALAVLAPLLINIVFFHAFLAPAGVALPVVLLALELYLAWAYRAVFRPMLAKRVAPEA